MDKILPWLLSAGGGAIGGHLIGLFGRLKSMAPMLKTLLGAVGGVGGFKLAEMSNLVPSMGAVEQAGIGAGAGAVLTGLLGALMIRKRR